MGLTSFKGNSPSKNEITVAKNYLEKDELSVLNRLVSAYLDIAEINAMQRKTLTMKDWIEILDGFIKMSRQDILTGAGKISAELAQRKAFAEYDTYREKSVNELTEVEKQFLASIQNAHRLIKEANKNKK